MIITYTKKIDINIDDLVEGFIEDGWLENSLFIYTDFGGMEDFEYINDNQLYYEFGKALMEKFAKTLDK